MESARKFMVRCIELAELGAGLTAPNPLVGAVIVCSDRIIGEGYHHEFGKPHAEVNAVNDAVTKGNESFLSQSTLYVNLEPCSHSGKTPPCADLIIRKKIPQIVIGCNDPFPEVNGRGIQKLKDAGLNVVTNFLEKESRHLNRRFITFHAKNRPYVLLKFARTSDNFIAPIIGDKKISSEFTNIEVHKWRSEESAIMVGTTTALEDNPRLTARKWNGKNPIRIVIDKNLRLPKELNIFDSEAETIIFNNSVNRKEKNIEHIKIDFAENVPEQMLSVLYEKKILSVMIEGGSNLLKQFIEKNLWDEARIITSQKIFITGISAPEIKGEVLGEYEISGDHVQLLRNLNIFKLQPWNY